MRQTNADAPATAGAAASPSPAAAHSMMDMVAQNYLAIGGGLATLAAARWALYTFHSGRVTVWRHQRQVLRMMRTLATLPGRAHPPFPRRLDRFYSAVKANGLIFVHGPTRCGKTAGAEIAVNEAALANRAPFHVDHALYLSMRLFPESGKSVFDLTRKLRGMNNFGT